MIIHGPLTLLMINYSFNVVVGRIITLSVMIMFDIVDTHRRFMHRAFSLIPPAWVDAER